jgi:hypothetical protein
MIMRVKFPARLGAIALAAAAGGLLMSTAAQAYYVPPFKGNDTGGIIAWSLVGQTNVKQLAMDHCASYGKMARLTGAQKYYGGYISFACVWVRPGRYDAPLRVRY